MERILSDVGFVVYCGCMISMGPLFAQIICKRAVGIEPCERLLIAYALGYASAVLLAVLGMAVGLPMLLLPIGSATVAVLGWPSLRNCLHPASLLGVIRKNRVALLLGAAACLLTAFVVLRAGRLDDGRHVFPALFANDYFNHMAVVAELAKHVPPMNMYYSGTAAHYYWLFHIVPASYHRLLACRADVRDLMLILDMSNVLFLFLCLGVLQRRLGSRGWSYVLSLVLLVVSYSYVGVLVLARKILPIFPSVLGAVDRLGLWGPLQRVSGFSHSLMRDFWVEPHATASLLFVSLAILVQCLLDGCLDQLRRGVLVGVLVFMAAGCDAFIGGIFGLWLAFDVASQVLRGRLRTISAWRYLLGCAVAGGCGGVIIAAMNMIGGQSQMFRLAPFGVVVLGLPAYLLLDFGAIFLLGVTGWWVTLSRGCGQSREVLLRVLPLGLIALLVGCFLRHRIETDIVLRKAGMLVQLTLWLGCGLGALHVVGRRGSIKYVALGITALGVVTLLTDVQAFGSLRGSEAYWNTVSAEEVTAFRWIRRSTEREAIVQGLPGYQGAYVYEINPIPSIAQRRVAVGTYMMSSLWGVGGRAAMARYREVRSIFEGSSSEAADRIVAKYGIDYLYLGPRELDLLGRAGDRDLLKVRSFHVVYSSDSVRVLKCRGTG